MLENNNLIENNLDIKDKGSSDNIIDNTEFNIRDNFRMDVIDKKVIKLEEDSEEEDIRKKCQGSDNNKECIQQEFNFEK